MRIRPKYRAVVRFSTGGHRFAAGDPVPPGIALDTALRFGERFVHADTARARRARATKTEEASTATDDNKETP